MNDLNQHNLVLQEGQYSGAIEQNIQIDGAIVSATSYTQTSIPQWHCHENMHIAFVLHKAVSKTRKQEYHTDLGGSLLCYHAGEMHLYTPYDPVSRSSNIEIPVSFLKKYSLSEPRIKENIAQTINAKSLLLAIQAEMDGHSDYSYTHILALLLELLSSSEINDSKTPAWTGQLRDLLHDQWNQPLRLQELSKIIGIHPVTISKNFRRYFSCTLGEYRRKIKIEKSLLLIRKTDMSLSEIAHYCQFADQSHFIRNFKVHTGFLPNEFRRY